MKAFHGAAARTAGAALCLAAAVGAPAWAQPDLLDTLLQKGILSQDEYQQLRAQQAPSQRSWAGVRSS